jgi:hypothetical protein
LGSKFLAVFLSCELTVTLPPGPRDKEFIDAITPEVVHYVKGKIVAVEGEDDEGPKKQE